MKSERALEEYAISTIHGTHMKKKPPRKRVTLLDDIDIQWSWDEWQIHKLRELWKQGLHIEDIARQLNIDQTSVELCIWWQAELGKIQAREGGAYGSR